MKIIHLVIAILLVSTSHAFAKTASETATDYFNVLKQKNKVGSGLQTCKVNKCAHGQEANGCDDRPGDYC